MNNVGSAAEEAAKLFTAMEDWARQRAGHAFDEEHIATGSPECQYCPVCQVIHAVRSTSPEVKEHLAVAASSLMHAAAGLLATHTGPSSSSPVQKIDLDDGDDGGSWDEEP